MFGGVRWLAKSKRKRASISPTLTFLASCSPTARRCLYALLATALTSLTTS
uniref:Uncharacterized protein n=1 Tax=uncultured marine virus TaxID=186617 RepID=A0A0F7L2P0_9VIRU|nr:hypothetical protein [uncultured marine virus]